MKITKLKKSTWTQVSWWYVEGRVEEEIVIQAESWYSAREIARRHFGLLKEYDPQKINTESRQALTIEALRFNLDTTTNIVEDRHGELVFSNFAATAFTTKNAFRIALQAAKFGRDIQLGKRNR